MFCRKCGTEIAEGHKFCAKCGTPVSVSTTGHDAFRPEKKTYTFKAGTTGTASRSVLIALIIGAGIVLAALMVLIAVVLNYSKGNSADKSRKKTEKKIETENAGETVSDDSFSGDETEEAIEAYPVEQVAEEPEEYEPEEAEGEEFVYDRLSSVQEEFDDTETQDFAEKCDPGSKEFILPDSNHRFYERSELENLTDDELRLARNELYARHGRKFRNEDLQQHFSSMSWYSPEYDPDEFDRDQNNILNRYEIHNRDLIVEIEKNR